MLTRILFILLLALLYAWVIFSTLPYRRQVVQNQEANDYYKLLDWQLENARNEYERVKTGKVSREELLDTEERLAMLLWEKRQFFQSIELLKSLAIKLETEKNAGYSDRWVKTRLRLADLYRDVNDWDNSEKAYKEVLAYDEEKIGKDNPMDSRLARDHNNLGLFYYMKATSQTDEKLKNQLLKQATDELNMAISKYRANGSADTPAEGNSLWNLYLILRDSGRVDEANEVKARAEAIDNKMNRPCKAP